MAIMKADNRYSDPGSILDWDDVSPIESTTPQLLALPIDCRANGPRQVRGRIDQSHVGERLRKVANQPLRPHIVFLR